MADTFQIEIATPERLLASERAIRAQIPGKTGYLGILPGHAALLSELGIGILTFATAEGGHYAMAVHGGYVQVLHDQVRVLADIAEPGTEIDVDRAQRALQRGQQEMVNISEGSSPADALEAVMRAEARLEAARKASKNED